MNRMEKLTIGAIYPLYVAKVERKGRSAEDVDAVITWLTGLDAPAVQEHVAAGSTLPEFFAAGTLNENADLITGVICGVRVEEITDPLTQKVRYLDKLVDEVARGKALDKIRRSRPDA